MDLRTAKRTEGKEVGSVIFFFHRMRVFFHPVQVRLREFAGVGQKLELLYREFTQDRLSSFCMGELQLMNPGSESDLFSTDLEAV